jgi:hypothetical protein
LIYPLSRCKIKKQLIIQPIVCTAGKKGVAVMKTQVFELFKAWKTGQKWLAKMEQKLGPKSERFLELNLEFFERVLGPLHFAWLEMTKEEQEEFETVSRVYDKMGGVSICQNKVG